MQVIRCMLNFDKRHINISINHFVVTLELAFVLGLFFRSGLGLLSVSLRRRVRRTLYDLYCPYCLPEVMVNFTREAREHFVTLI